jgi:TolA-binding protein
MMRRLSLTVLMLLFCMGPAWARWDKEDKAYLVDQFRALQEQLQALKAQLDALGGQVAELRQNQQQLQAVIIRQQSLLQEMDQLVSSVRLGQEESFSGLRRALNELRSDNEKAFASLTGRSAEPGGAATAPERKGTVEAPPTRVVQGYITIVDKDNTVTVDLGSGQGIQVGSRLAVYKANDANTRVGLLEVVQVVDTGNSRARIVTMNSGIQPEFSDFVRLE